jgi:hypothetical protein
MGWKGYVPPLIASPGGLPSRRLTVTSPMRCPSCDSEIHDPDDAFCSSCGHPLKTSSSAATGPIEEKRGAGSTVEIDAEPSVEEDHQVVPTRTGAIELVSGLASAIRRSAVGGGWLDATSAAALGFLGLMCVGAVLLLGAKLQYSGLGSEASPLSVLDAIVILSLGCLGVPIDFERVEITVLPLGALLAAGLVISWAARIAVRKAGHADLTAQALDGAKTGLPFGVMCLVGALVFRMDAARADAGVALVLGVIWGVIFGAAGGLRATRSLWPVVWDGVTRLRAWSPVVYEGMGGAGVMLMAALVFATIGSLVWIVAGLASGAPSDSFGVGDAGAAIVYLIAFGPNVVVAIISFSLGASIEIGAQVTLGARVVGPLKEFSLFDWSSENAPWYAFLLLLIPVAACLLGGYSAGRNTSHPDRVVAVLGVAAAVFAVVVAVLAVLAEARLGAGLVRARGFGRVAPDPLGSLIFGAAWAAIVGWLGWRLGSRSQFDSRESVID